MSIGKKVLFGLGILFGLFVVLVIVFLLYLRLHSEDIEKVDNSILSPSSQILPKADNAYYDLKQSSDSLKLPQEKSQIIADMAKGVNWNDALANEILKNNTVALAAFDRASWKKGYQDPTVQGDLRTYRADTMSTSSILSDARKAAQISAIKSWVLFKQGKEKEALDNTLNIIYLGQLFESSPRANIIDYFVGMAIKGIGITSMQVMIPMSHLLSGDLKLYIGKLNAFKNNTAGLQEAFRMEYTMINNTKEQMIDSAGGQGAQELQVPFGETLLKSSFYYKPNQTRKLYVEQYQNFVDNAAKQCSEIVPRPKRITVNLSIIFVENAVGKILTDVSESSLSGVFDKRCQEEFSVLQTQIVLASQAYKNDNGAYSASLGLLSPNYLDTVDKQYEGKDIMYDAKTGVVSLAQ